ncbi:MAG: ATP-binding protein [Methylotenera sp.]|nr:ATP-binding protein [Methylotenera sp.]
MSKAPKQVALAQYSTEPFSDLNLAAIFKFDETNPRRLSARESGWLEFKQSFSWANKAEYAKTIAAFANSRGGYIVFGVRDRPREIIGTEISRWENTDPRDISEFLNQSLGVEIEWEGHIVSVLDVQLVVVYVREARKKPVIAAQSHKGVLTEGEIYYRYRGRSQKIRYADLQNLLEEQRRNEQANWLKLFRQIAKSGIENIALIDLVSGQGNGPGSKFFIDQETLPQLKFIREGHFVEHNGAPAIRLIGDASTIPQTFIQPERKVLAFRNIHLPDIIEAFLKKTPVENPLQFIRQLCFESTAYLPLYYFANLANLDSTDRIRELIKSVQSTSTSRKKILDRLDSTDDLSLPIPKGNHQTAGKLRLEKLGMLLREELTANIEVSDIKSTLEAIRCLQSDQTNENYLNPILLSWFNQHYTLSGHADLFRRAICHLDRIKYRN